MRVPVWRHLVFAAILVLGSRAEGAVRFSAADSALIAEMRDRFASNGGAAAESLASAFLEGVGGRYGSTSLEFAAGLHEVANQLLAAGSYARGESLLVAALGLRETNLGAADPLVGSTEVRIAYALRLQGRYEEALTHARRALDVAGAASGPGSLDAATALTSIGNILVQTGDYAGALERHLRCLEIDEQLLGADDVRTGRSLHNLAWVSYLLGRYADGERYGGRALAIAQSLATREPRWEADLGNTLAALAHAQGDYDSAVERQREVVLRDRESRGPYHPETLQHATNLTVFLTARGDYAEAISLVQQSRDGLAATVGVDHPEYAHALEVLAGIQYDTGDLVGAKSTLEECVALEEKNLGPDAPLLSHALDQLARVRRALGEHDGNRALLERALSIREAEVGPRSAALAGILIDLAAQWNAEGMRAEARRVLDRCLEIQMAELGQGHLQLAETHKLLADLDQKEGRLDGARDHLEQALAIRETNLGVDHPHTGLIAEDLARVYLGRGRPLDALETAIRAERIGSAHLAATAAVYTETQLLRYAEVRAKGKDVMLSLLTSRAADLPVDAPRRIWDVLIPTRAQILDLVAARRQSLEESPDTAVADLERDFQRANRLYANLLVRGDDGDPPAYRAALEGARLARERAEQALAATNSRVRGRILRARPDLAALSGALPPGTALAAFWQFNRVRSAGEAGEPWYAALVLPAGSDRPVAVDLGAAREIERCVDAWRRQVLAPSSDAALLDAGLALRRVVWDPVSVATGRCGAIALVPDGVLHLVNFLALPAGEGRYVAEDPRLLLVLSAERDLALPAERPTGEGLLALGGVDFDQRSPGTAASHRGGSITCPEFRDTRFGLLPSSREEVEEVASLWSAHAGSSVVRLTGGQATEAAFEAKARGRRVLHLATHGFFLGGECANPKAGGRGIGGMASSQGRPSTEEDLKLSGLALAGANRRGEAGPGEDDGVLTAEEISGLDLTGVEWAVLSACNTGLGTITRGEGVLGLRRAFAAAGVRTVIMSLWPVADRDARLWMRSFYASRFEGSLSTAEAVRDACRSRLQELRRAGEPTGPSSWGAFVASGDWR